MTDGGDLELIERIRHNAAVVRLEIDKAARARAADPADIKLIAVTKTHPASLVRAAIAAGLSEFGENYAREAVAKVEDVGDKHVRWHFIGHLQSNKTSLIAGRFATIQSVDSRKLAMRLSEQAQTSGPVQDILIQVHLGDETSKGGVEPGKLLSLYESVVGLSGIRILGLMGMAPLTESDGSRPDPRRYYDELNNMYHRLPVESRRVLSMGMSGDYIAAVSAGSNMVRIGSALFGPRLSSLE